jgi:hypothetical protein
MLNGVKNADDRNELYMYPEWGEWDVTKVESTCQESRKKLKLESVPETRETERIYGVPHIGRANDPVHLISAEGLPAH